MTIVEQRYTIVLFKFNWPELLRYKKGMTLKTSSPIKNCHFKSSLLSNQKILLYGIKPFSWNKFIYQSLNSKNKCKQGPPHQWNNFHYYLNNCSAIKQNRQKTMVFKIDIPYRAQVIYSKHHSAQIQTGFNHKQLIKNCRFKPCTAEQNKN